MTTEPSNQPSPTYDNTVEVHEMQVAQTGIEAQTYDDPKWFGVPPKGTFSPPSREQYVLEVIGIMLLEICIWGVYRFLTAPFFAGYGSEFFFLFHIIFAPTIHLVPIILYWRFRWRESGLPFTFTKKLLFSGVIVGFLAAIMWRLLEELAWDAMAGAAGATVSGSFSLFNLMDSSTMTLLALMTFVHFFIVGPVEELEFRSFAQDQVSRVVPNWQALMISSVLFGCSHIPIAVFVYQFAPHVFVVALFGWIAAGFVFGALYMWSRNILACIVMHGMGNWQLSIFYFQSTEVIGALSPATYIMIGIIHTILVTAIMILFFYLVHRYYWQPHRRGEAAFGGAFQKLQDFIHGHDFEKQPLKITAVYMVVFIVAVCGIIIAATHALGETDLSKFSTTQVEDTGGSGSKKLGSFVESPETLTGSGALEEGQSESISVASGPDKYIKEITVTLTWTDEDDIRYLLRTYENQPDTFSLDLSSSNASVSETGSNQHGQQGSISAELSFSIEDIAELIEEDNENYEVLIEITMVDAGDLFTTGVIGFTDTGNSYEYEINVVWLVPKTGQ